MLSLLTETTFAGNELWRIVTFFTLILISLVVGRIARALMEKARPTERSGKARSLDVLIRSLAKPTVLAAFTVGFTFASSVLILSETIGGALSTATRILTVLSVGYVIYSVVDLLDFYLASFSGKTESKVDDMLFPLIGRSIRITIAVVVSLQAIQALSDKPVTSIIAGLGMGGLAIALAGQDTVKNFFGSLVIIFDKPFEIGDRVIVDGHDGPIESVGFRSTKLRTLEGHLVTIPNGELVNKTVQNIGKRPYIRRLSNITVTYDTSPLKLNRAIQILNEILQNHEGMHPEFPPRVYFNDFNDCSLNIIMIYWFFPPDYWAFMAFTEKVNKQILTRFNEEGIEFAFPSQTVYLPDLENKT